MYSVTNSFGLNGLRGFAVAVEADVSGGLPAFSIVGLPDSAVAPVAARLQYHARNVAVGRGHDRFALLGVGLDVHARMEMPGTDFAEIGRVEPLFELPQGVDVVVGGELLALCPEAGRRKQKKY